MRKKIFGGEDNEKRGEKKEPRKKEEMAELTNLDFDLKLFLRVYRDVRNILLPIHLVRDEDGEEYRDEGVYRELEYLQIPPGISESDLLTDMELRVLENEAKETRNPDRYDLIMEMFRKHELASRYFLEGNDNYYFHRGNKNKELCDYIINLMVELDGRVEQRELIYFVSVAFYSLGNEDKALRDFNNDPYVKQHIYVPSWKIIIRQQEEKDGGLLLIFLILIHRETREKLERQPFDGGSWTSFLIYDLMEFLRGEHGETTLLRYSNEMLNSVFDRFFSGGEDNLMEDIINYFIPAINIIWNPSNKALLEQRIKFFLERFLSYCIHVRGLGRMELDEVIVIISRSCDSWIAVHGERENILEIKRVLNEIKKHLHRHH